jgi:hypothetical protein
VRIVGVELGSRMSIDLFFSPIDCTRERKIYH